MKAAALIVVVLVCTPAALAKGRVQGQACGASGCVALDDARHVDPFMSWWIEPFVPLGTPKPAPFFRIVLTSGDPFPIRWTLLYSHARGAMRITELGGPYRRIGPYWRIVPPDARARIDRVTKGLEPFPRSPRWRAR